MTVYRRYVFDMAKDLPQESHEKALRMLQAACERRWWFDDPSVAGRPFGRLTVAFTVSARDQWWAHRRALTLAVDVWYALGMQEKDLPEPLWEGLDPDARRGRKPEPAAS